LWSPEIRLLQECGATFRVRRAWLYKKAPALKDWAEWILSSLHDQSDTTEPWKKLILKHWSRALIGRFGMRYRTWESFGSAPDSRVCTFRQYNSENGSIAEMMQVGTDIFTLGDQREIDDGCPQITSYIMSEARARLWRARTIAGAENVLYVDTDSLLVNSDGHKRIQAQYNVGVLDGLRSKGKYASAFIYGPRSIILGKRPVVSGMPKDSIQRPDGKWRGEVWRSAKESVKRSEPDRVVIEARLFTMAFNQHRRYFNADGSTLPYSLPGYAPDGVIVKRPTRKERLESIDYPPMLAHHAPKANAIGPVKGRHARRNNVRSMHAQIPDPSERIL
jgi:hypothetical protein